MYVVVNLFLAVGALNSQNNLLFAALGVAIGGLLVSGVVSGWSLMGLRLEREPVGPGVVGRPLPIRYVLHNTNRFMPAFALHVEEVRTRREQRGWWGVFAPTRAFLAFVPPRGRARGEARAQPVRRGEARLRMVRVWSTFPFGLAKKSLTFELPETALIHPGTVRIRKGLLDSVTARSPAGTGSEAFPGHGEEFYGLREYTQGDSPRRIAWRSSARTGQLVVREHASPSPARLWVVLRLGPEGTPSEDERAVTLAAAVLREAEREGVAVGLAIPAGSVALMPRPGRRHVDRLLTSLAQLELEALDGVRRAGDVPLPNAVARDGATVVVESGATGRLAKGGQHGLRLSGSQLVGLADLNDPDTVRVMALLDGVTP
jgi:uncharacterized protein (DUF58 family)